MSYDRLPMYDFSASPTTQRHRKKSYSTYLPRSGRRSPSPVRTRDPAWTLYSRPPRVCLHRFRYFIPLLFGLLFVLFGLYLYEPHIELAFYSRNWVNQEIEAIKPLSGCFDSSRVSSRYNVSEALYGKKSNELQAGISLRFGLDCYDLAGTVQSPPKPDLVEYLPADDRTQFHTYWRSDLAPFGPRQEHMLKSFFATQDLATSRLVLWSNGDLSENVILQRYLWRYPDAFAVKVADIRMLSRGTELEYDRRLFIKDKKAWLDGDMIRLLLLWNYGGVWVDMDSLLTRDLEPLLEHEFVTQWDCYDKKYTPLNGALMRFHQHSPYLCEAFHIMATDRPPRPHSTDWGSILYYKLWRRLIAESIPPFKILPFCFTDARSCRLDNRLPDPFKPDNAKGKWTSGLGLEEGGGLDIALSKVFGVHLHNQWEKEFPKGGWVDRLLLQRHDRILKEDEEYEYQ